MKIERDERKGGAGGGAEEEGLGGLVVAGAELVGEGLDLRLGEGVNDLDPGGGSDPLGFTALHRFALDFFFNDPISTKRSVERDPESVREYPV